MTIKISAIRYPIWPASVFMFGVVHNRGKWSMELSASASFYTDNENYNNGKKHEEDVYLVGQGHLIYTFMPGFWVGASAGYGYGGESTIDRVSADDLKGNIGWGLSTGISVSRNFGFKIAYVGTRTDQDTGSDTDTFTIGCSLQW